MTAKQFISIIVTVASVALGGGLGSSALEQANAAPLAGPRPAADPHANSPAAVPHRSQI
jgi:hypothetical protein